MLFFFNVWPAKNKKSPPNDHPWKPFPLGPCPDDRAQNSVQDSLDESSGDPNPTLVFFKNTFQILSILTPLVPTQNSTPSGRRRPTCRKKGKSQLVLFVLDSSPNWIYGILPFFSRLLFTPLSRPKDKRLAPTWDLPSASFEDRGTC